MTKEEAKKLLGAKVYKTNSFEKEPIVLDDSNLS